MELKTLEETDQSGSESAAAVKVIELTKVFTGRTRKFTRSPGKFLRSLVVGDPWRTEALSTVSFSVDHGEVFGLLGPNGSGKTTLIKILSNLIIPDSGAAFVEGINVARRPYAAAEKIQTVLSESIGLEKRLSIKDNLMLFASLYNLPRAEAEEKVARYLDFFGLSKFADKSSQSMSTGMSRKLTVCRVLLSHASVIVFDEPTSGLDPVSAEDFRRLILQDLVKRENKTIIMATHNLVEATSMCTHIALLNQGKLLTVGTPDEVKKTVEDRVDLAITLSGGNVPLESIRGELTMVDGVHVVETIDAHGTKKVTVSGRKDLDYMRVLSVISAAGFKVQSLETSSPSLEDAFLRLTKEGRS